MRIYYYMDIYKNEDGTDEAKLQHSVKLVYMMCILMPQYEKVLCRQIIGNFGIQ